MTTYQSLLNKKRHKQQTRKDEKVLDDSKKKKILSFEIVWMDLENTTLSEIRQSEKDKYHMISLICEM